ncbi:FAD-dependent monooxygenase [Methyloligella sp. GL2]|nr:FAD-dependent monooxygenase [Methyloligella sp. GL2]
MESSKLNGSRPPASTGRVDVAIAGGGFVGLTLALALAKLAPDGFRIAVIDGKPFEEAGKGDARASALSAASRNLLQVLEIWPAIAPYAEPITAIDITDSPLQESGPRPLFVGFDNELKDGEPGAYVVQNGPLLTALAKAAAAEPNIELIAPDTVSGFEAESYGIDIQLESGRHLRAALLVAADGRRSALREAAGIKIIGWTYPQTGIVTTVSHSVPHGGKAVQHFLPAGPFALLPLPENRTSIVWTEEADEADRIMALDDAGFLKELERRFGAQLGQLSLAGPRQSFPLSLHVARSFIGPRFALVGDAAHGVHPLAGQGLNIGLRDVAALTEILVEGARLGLEPGDQVLLQRYERWRRFDSAVSALAMDLVNRLFSNENATMRTMRDMGLSVLDRLAPVKRMLVREASGKTGAVPQLLKGKRP